MKQDKQDAVTSNRHTVFSHQTTTAYKRRQVNNLINFLVKHITWFIVLFYVTVSCVLLFQHNPYQQSVWLSSANSLTATVLKGFDAVSSYFNLKTINEQLQQRNAALEGEVVALKKQVADYQLQVGDTNHTIVGTGQQFDYVLAHVISNSTSQPYNYITIDRGSADGISPEMGVVDHNGVVGIVNVVGHHSARILSLLNPYMQLSCSVKSNGYFGQMTWDGKDPHYAILQDLPKQGRYHRGDTIVTSGYSAVFPAGITVGVVTGYHKNFSSTGVSLKVRLAADFTQLSTVRAVNNRMRVELQALESKDANATTKQSNAKEGKQK